MLIVVTLCRIPGTLGSRTVVQVSRGAKQYLYDEEGHEYLDCTNGTAHVGHCHPQVGTTRGHAT
jgi:4-aminobutyrate aminotransferase-like enzyme